MARHGSRLGRRSASGAGGGFITPSLLAVLIVAITVLTGSASQPEPTTGRYALYVVDVGEQYSMRTSIYGWIYSVPSLILLAILLAAPGPVFSGASLVVCALGVGLWATVLLSAVSARHPVQVLAASW